MSYIRSPLFGGSLLVAGSCIGAGMLGLPVLTGYMGFIPSIICFFLIWGFMAMTGLLLAEANLLYGKPSGLISIAGASLGKKGKALTWVLFLYLFYSLTVAYILGSGHLFSDLMEHLFHVEIGSQTGSLLFTALFGFIVYLGARSVDLFNRLLMVGLVLSYGILMAVCLPVIDAKLILRQEPLVAFGVLPALIVSFGFHNIVPSLYRYLKGDRRSIVLAIVTGSLFPLAVYLLWELAALGVLPVEGSAGLREAFEKGVPATQAIRQFTGSPHLQLAAQGFAFFALTTSFLAQSLSFVDFLSDGLRIKKGGMRSIGLCSLVLIPPFLLGMVYPTIFYACLEYAGAFGATVLFGILPVLMVFRLRKRKGSEARPLVRGGTPLLYLLLGVSVALILLGVARQTGLIELYG